MTEITSKAGLEVLYDAPVPAARRKVYDAEYPERMKRTIYRSRFTPDPARALKHRLQ